ncbi:hypothetical protein [Filimonas lacunae]|nr:hypothetical protein [Filimonas lacunae]BAV06203.1 hypothetical protein FLA_2219 [Filimonas lacunae]
MDKKKQEIGVIEKILDACYQANPDGLFVMSLMHQYEERGSLSKKQLQGLLGKAQKVQDMPPNWVATLEAVILKMPTRFKSEVKVVAPVFQKDEKAGQLITAILDKYPQHKRVVFLRSKYDNNETLTTAEVSELERFSKLLLK